MEYTVVAKMRPVETSYMIMSNFAGLTPTLVTEKGTLATLVGDGDSLALGLIGSPQRNIGQKVSSEEGIQHAYGHTGRVFNKDTTKSWGVYVRDTPYSEQELQGMTPLLDHLENLISGISEVVRSRSDLTEEQQNQVITAIQFGLTKSRRSRPIEFLPDDDYI